VTSLEISFRDQLVESRIRNQATSSNVVLNTVISNVALNSISRNIALDTGAPSGWGSSSSLGRRWRKADVSAGKGAKTGFPDAGVSIALACEGRWRTPDAGVEKGAKIGFPGAGVSIALACEGLLKFFAPTPLVNNWISENPLLGSNVEAVWRPKTESGTPIQLSLTIL
jgi:hypothetical protein